MRALTGLTLVSTPKNGCAGCAMTGTESRKMDSSASPRRTVQAARRDTVSAARSLAAYTADCTWVRQTARRPTRRARRTPRRSASVGKVCRLTASMPRAVLMFCATASFGLGCGCLVSRDMLADRTIAQYVVHHPQGRWHGLRRWRIHALTYPQGGSTLYVGPAVRWQRESSGTAVCIRDAFYNVRVCRVLGGFVRVSRQHSCLCAACRMPRRPGPGTSCATKSKRMR